MEMGGNFCQILELGGTTIKGRRVLTGSIDIHLGRGQLWKGCGWKQL